MAGGMARGRGPTLAERSAGRAGTDLTPDPDLAAELAAVQDRPRPVSTRHCWVTGLPDSPGRWAGLLAEWRRDGDGDWQGRVVYAVDVGAGVTVMVEAWVSSRHLQPAT